MNTKTGPVPGLKIRKLPVSSFLFASGLRPKDVILTINGQNIHDELDMFFYAAESVMEIEFLRNNRKQQTTAVRSFESSVDAEFFEKPVNRCKNNCVFCFINQMPPGFRSGLYIKDEDFKHSFLNGNYVTLSSATKNDLDRVVQMGLSPLYISVHATDTGVRKRMLGNSAAPDILSQLCYLADNGISFHTQIVVCPGYNDKAVLEKSVVDLLAFKESLLSIAIVPVGLTKHRKVPLDPVDREGALAIFQLVEKLNRQGPARGKLFLADELFITAQITMPGKSYYEDYPQIENGVGLVCQLLENWKMVKRQLRQGKLRFKPHNQPVLVVTSVLALPFLKKVFSQIENLTGGVYQVVSVENRVFGESVTVAGLITATDLIKRVKEHLKEQQVSKVLIPAIMFNYKGYTLDGYSAQRIARALGAEVQVVSGIGDIPVGKKYLKEYTSKKDTKDAKW